ncbi:tRNA (cytidine(34)-2'-O)-methyltransferase [Paramagnetospirillum magnetotacticum MS-1]|uniref:tRNA (cytidine(34)-2'-O)-methyltransferase n=1 Tax=Paramagnetospirillum magnetotacticum MS-1 TaxID=272627 RepID=A0A0C2YR12_PARME|nr:TrmH family RNA methyltransferase [Paramagnetospirillum magnetotacticum]KIL97573.1 tRNA (cytidine(34)-2'-O)-methyltransferase [Paramagnetospirillum magnetotacticum MS-1]
MERLRLALFQPDIPQNAGTLLRLSACLGVGVDIIEPCGFVLDERKVRRAGMDYIHQASYIRHVSWDAFAATLASGGRRLVLLTTGGADRHDRFPFAPGDTIMVGRESCGVPTEVFDRAGARIRIPMRAGARSLNVALAAAIATAEALRRLDGFPEEGD